MRKTVNIIVAGLLSGAFVLLGVFVFEPSYRRFWEALCDLMRSVGYYFCELFGIAHTIEPTVTKYSAVMQWSVRFPVDFEGFIASAGDYFTLLFSKDNFTAWGKSLSVTLGNMAKVISVLLPCVVILVFAIKRLYAKCNTRHNQDTLPLRFFKRFTGVTCLPCKRFICGFVAFLKEKRFIWICWAVMWAFHLNAASILTGFLAYYFYFAVAFDFGSLYVQVVKLVIDLQTVFRGFPWWLLVLAVYPVFHRFRKRIAENRLRRNEARNCGFINELPIVSITCGSMGKKKTTMLTDMTLSQEVMFRQKALKVLQDTDFKFPYFPWLMFEKELQKCMEYGAVYNLATAKEWVKLKRSRFLKHRSAARQLYGYDYKRYGAVYDDALKVSSLFDAMETYAQAYFIYVIECSLIVANYSVRTDSKLMDNGNFPLWATDFFSENRRKSRYAHILDFDVLRLGKKVLENNPKAGSFEFGVVTITEIGKERGNNLELKEVKKGGEETNQKNDLFNAWLKMCRHSATVDNFPFIKVFTDEQRPESWGADARDLCDIIRIVSSGEMRLALPFYTIEEMLSEWAFNRFVRMYYDFRYRRGDNTLTVYLLKGITAWLWKRNVKMYNRYGYCILKIEKERGTMDVKAERKKYFLINKKIYSNRFTTDCFSDYFNDMAKKSRKGLKDYMEYAAEKASVEELKMQNSYFINGLYKDENANGSA